MRYTRIYNISDLKELKACEKMQEKLYNNYSHVRVIVIGLDKVKIEYR